MRVLAGAMLCGALMAQVSLPPATQEVKVLHGRMVSVEGAERGGWIVVRDLTGKVLRKVQAGAGVEGVRAAEIKDYTLDAARTLVVSLGVAYSLGRSERLVAFYPEQGPARFLGMEDVVCLKVAADEATGVWCLGPGLEDTLLHRVSGPAAGPWSLLARKKMRVLANDGGETRAAFDSGQIGVPQVLAAGRGRLALFLPNTLAVHVVDTGTGEREARELGVEPKGRSSLSFASDGEDLWGLRPEGGEDGLTTPYRLHRWAGSWKEVHGVGPWQRGTALVGAEVGRVYVWNRAARRVEVVPGR